MNYLFSEVWEFGGGAFGLSQEEVNSASSSIIRIFVMDYYYDIFLLKGIASNQNHGVKEHLDTKIEHSDFWVLNIKPTVPTHYQW